jgi:hypothetical protein
MESFWGGVGGGVGGERKVWGRGGAATRLLLERREACARWQRRDFDCDDGERSVKKCARKIQRCEPLGLKFSSGKTNIAQQSEVNRQLLTSQFLSPQLINPSLFTKYKIPK